MARIEKTVFISYRRTDVYIALAVYDNLTRNGYDVFFDYKSIPAGDFEQIIISNIKARAHFLIILTPDCLNRCSEPGDWLRREIETAMDEKRNVIPMFFKGFNFGSPLVQEKLTGKLKSFSRYNGPNMYEDYFDAGMERLREQFLNTPLSAILHPVSTEVNKVVRRVQFAADQALHTEDVKGQIRSLDVNASSVTRHGNVNITSRARSASATDPKLGLFVPPEFSESQYAPPPSRVQTLMIGGIEFIKIPHGEFVMGSTVTNKLAFDQEKPQHTLKIPYDYLMARFAVTNEQFAEFVRDEIYITVAEKQGGGWVYLGGQWRRVEDANWRHPQGRKSNIDGLVSKHPVVQVTWEDGIKYLEWLNQKYGNEMGGLVFRAPTEAEWEKAARGMDGREWPWGNEFISKNCNSEECGIDCTTPVGSFSPQGDSPYGIGDMAGNIWEWTASLWGKTRDSSTFCYPYNFRDGRESMSSESAPHVLRGGSFRTSSQLSRVAYRDRFKSIKDRNDNCGLRVVVAPRIP